MRADIFCRRVDNYGDIGVCWRLARELRGRAGWDVRLWMDDLHAFKRLEPSVDAAAPRQSVAGIQVVHWTADAPALAPAQVVIEAFACDPPAAYRAAMRKQPPIWLNLEYLSAEDWVASFHGLPSPQPDGLVKHFFFPGFTPATGGLLRERDLLDARDAFQASRSRQRAFLADLPLAAPALAAWEAGAQVLTLFCYPGAPYAALARALAHDGTPTLLLVPEGVAPGLEAVVATPASSTLHLARVPFLPQDDYDRLLWCADLNFVRGEDSFIRAAWAGRPLVWQIYPQEEQAHLVKLEAWLELYAANQGREGPAAMESSVHPAGHAHPPTAGTVAAEPVPTAAVDLIRAWNDADAPQAVAPAFAAAMQPQAREAWLGAARTWSRHLATQRDLATSLVEFCANISRKC
jgi:uncharacterized repeat protein (TIGR03837 family)